MKREGPATVEGSPWSAKMLKVRFSLDNHTHRNSLVMLQMVLEQ